MLSCGLAALWSSLLMDDRGVCWELWREPERHPEGLTSEAAADLFVLLQLEDVSGHKE